MYKSYKDKEFELYEWALNLGKKGFPNTVKEKLLDNEELLPVLQEVEFILDNPEDYTLNGLPDAFQYVYVLNKQIDQSIVRSHIRKTHSLDLKIKQLEERIEHLESK